jgi:DNA-directed RNA polymerase subunit omega
MSRADLESCLERIPNHFELCAVAAKRARQLARGAPSQVPAGTHKSTVQSLIEVSRGLVDRTVLDQADLPMIESPPPSLGPLDDY